MAEQLEIAAKPEKERPKFTTAEEVVGALREKYPASAYAVLEQVGNGTGFHCNRHADLVVMSLWPSRGLEIIGIEVKVRRADWLKELNTPEKAESIARHCDRWYLALGDAEIVKPGELPKGWGLMVPKKGGGLHCRVEATLAEPEPPIDRSFLAAILRRAQEQLTPQSRLDAEYKRGRQEARTEYEQWKKQDRDHALQDFKNLRERVSKFEKESGVDISNSWLGGNIGEAVRMVQNGAYLRERDRLSDLHKRVLQCAEYIATQLKTEESVSQ